MTLILNSNIKNMTEYTPKPTIVIPPDSFKNYEDPESVNAIVLNSKYTLYEIIGMGSQGVVYNTNHDGIVIKKIKGVINTKIHILASNLKISPKLYETFYLEGHTYLVYERLYSNVFNGSKIYFGMSTINQIRDLCSKMITNGIFHNDLKDTNIMFDKYNDVKIIDFDSALYFRDMSLQEIKYHIQVNSHMVVLYHSYELPFTNEQRNSHNNMLSLFLDNNDSDYF